MSDVFSKIASEFKQGANDIFSKIASEFKQDNRAKRVSKKALTQPLSLRRDYGARTSADFLADSTVQVNTGLSGMDFVGPGNISDRLDHLPFEYPEDYIEDDLVLDREDWSETFDLLDYDQDGALTHDEWDNVHFDHLDLDGDGEIDRIEWEKGFDHLDANGDDLIDEDEYLFEMNDSFRFARFHSGPKGQKEFAQWKKDNPEAAEEFDRQTEINKDVVKNRAKAMKSEDFQENSEELEELEAQIEELEGEQEEILDKASKKAFDLYADHEESGSYMSRQNLREIDDMSDFIIDDIGAEDLDDWVEDKISHAHSALSDVARYRGYRDDYTNDDFIENDLEDDLF